MKVLTFIIILLASLAITGCDKSTTGGPGANAPNTNKSVPPATGGTFTLSLSPDSVSIKQGEAKAITVTINRNDNFHEVVALEFSGIPKGVSIDPARPALAQGDTETKFTLKSTDEAALGDFVVKMVGHPTKGLDSLSDIKLTIAAK